MNFYIRATEDNIVAKIRNNAMSLDGNVVAMGDFEAVRNAIKKDPVCFVIFESESWSERELTGSQEGTVAWHVLIMTRSLRGQKEGRQGEGGGYDLSDEVLDILRNYDPINDVQGTPEVEYPMSLASRQQLGDPDTSEYYMWCRFTHPVDTFI